MTEVLVLRLLRGLRAPSCDLSPTDRLVLIAIASYDGLDNFTPSIPRLEEVTGLGRRGVLYALSRLEDARWIDRHSPGKGRRNHYTLDRARVEALNAEMDSIIHGQPGQSEDQCTTCTSAPDAPVHEQHQCTECTPTRAPDAPLPVHDVHPPRAPRAPQGSEKVSNKDLKKGVSETRARAMPKIESQEVESWLAANGLPALDGNEGANVEDWLNYHRDKGKPSADPKASYARWCNNGLPQKTGIASVVVERRREQQREAKRRDRDQHKREVAGPITLEGVNLLAQLGVYPDEVSRARAIVKAADAAWQAQHTEQFNQGRKVPVQPPRAPAKPRELMTADEIAARDLLARQQPTDAADWGNLEESWLA